jgi:hypothetical protein
MKIKGREAQSATDLSEIERVCWSTSLSLCISSLTLQAPNPLTHLSMGEPELVSIAQ